MSVHSVPSKRVGSRARWALWILLILGWIAVVPILWSAFSTLPSAERLSRSRMIEIPTLRSVALVVAGSAAELAVALALLVPWRPGRYLSRLWVAAVGAWVWFFASTPLDLTRLAWVHRRWLAGTAAALLVAAMVATVARVVSRRRGA